MILASLCLAAVTAPAESPAAFTGDVERSEAVELALTWLVENANRGALGDLSMPNSEGKWLVAAAAALFVVEVYGKPVSLDTEAFETAVAGWEATLQRASGGRGMTGNTFASWIDGCRVPLFVERSLRSGKPHSALPGIAAGFADRQNTEGGWTHGAAGQVVSFYPSTLIAASNLALIALGSTRRLHGAAYESSIEDGLTLLQRVQAPTGGFAYGGLSYRVGVEAGRTCGAVLALAALDQRDTEQFRRAVTYVRKNMTRVPHGHASPAMHVMLGALATAVMSEPDAARYADEVLTQVINAQHEDGWFGDLVDDSPDTMKLMSSEILGRTYVTALHAAALTASHSEFARWLSSDTTQSSLGAPLAAAVEVHPARTDSIAGARAYEVIGGVLHVLDNAGIVHRLDTFTGTSLRMGPFAIPEGEVISFAMRGDGVLLAISQGGDSIASSTLTRARAGANSSDWATALNGPNVRGLWSEATVWLMGMDGRSIEVDATTGAVRRRLPSGSNPLRAPLWADATTIVRGSGPNISADFCEREDWSRRLRGLRGASSPTHTSIIAVDEIIYAGSTDGLVLARRLTDGEFIGEIACGSSIVEMTAFEGILIAVADAGQLIAIRDGKELWRLDGRDGIETHSKRSMSAAAGVLSTSWAGHLFDIDLATGKILWSHVTGADETWARTNAGWIRLNPTDGALHLQAFRFEL